MKQVRKATVNANPMVLEDPRVFGQYSRKTNVKATLMQICPEPERQQGFEHGEMNFTGPGGKIAFKLDFKDRDLRSNYLVMPFSVGEDVHALRYNPERKQLVVTSKADGVETISAPRNFVSTNPYHMGSIMMSGVQGTGIVLPAFLIARDHALAKNTGVAVADGVFLEKIHDLCQRAGYSETRRRPMTEKERKKVGEMTAYTPTMGGDLEAAGIMDDVTIMQCESPADERNNLDTHYRIVALENPSQQVKSYYHPRKGKQRI